LAGVYDHIIMQTVASDHQPATGSGRRFDIKFLTKQQQYAIPDTVFHVPGSCQAGDLNQLVNSTLSENDSDVADIEFDFLVEGNLLRLTLEEHMEELSAVREDFVYGEREVEVEYFTKQPAPEPHKSLVHDDWVSAVHADPHYVLSGCYDGTAQIWKLDGTHILTLPAHSGSPVKSVRWFSAKAISDAGIGDFDAKDHLFVTAAQDETLKIWKWSGQNEAAVQCLNVCKGHTRTVNCVDVNVDLIASGSMDCHLKVWALSADTKVAKDENRSKKPGSKKQKNVEGDAVGVRSGPSTRTPLVTLSGHTEAITCVKWITDRSAAAAAPEVATGSMDNTIRIWDIEVNEVKQTIVGSKAFLSIAYSHSKNALLSASTDRHIRLWDPRSTEQSQVVAAFTSHRGWVSSVDWSPSNDNFFVSGSYDNTVKYWDVRSPNAPLYDLMGHKDKVLSVDWSNSQLIVSGSADNMVKIFKNH
jgi:ribosome biogenesis protein YTM1